MRSVLVCCLIATIMGCDSSMAETSKVPSESQVKQAFDARARKGGEGAPVRLLAFKKTNGVGHALDDQFYVTEFEVEYEAVADYGEYWKKGERLVYTGEIVFQKTEAGWRDPAGAGHDLNCHKRGEQGSSRDIYCVK